MGTPQPTTVTEVLRGEGARKAWDAFQASSSTHVQIDGDLLHLRWTDETGARVEATVVNGEPVP